MGFRDLLNAFSAAAAAAAASFIHFFFLSVRYSSPYISFIFAIIYLVAWQSWFAGYSWSVYIFLSHRIHVNTYLSIYSSLTISIWLCMPFVAPIYLFIYSNKWFNECQCVSFCCCFLSVRSIFIVVCPPLRNAIDLLAIGAPYRDTVTRSLISGAPRKFISIHVYGTFPPVLLLISYYFYDCITRDFNLLFLFLFSVFFLVSLFRFVDDDDYNENSCLCNLNDFSVPAMGIGHDCDRKVFYFRSFLFVSFFVCILVWLNFSAVGCPFWSDLDFGECTIFR